MIRVFVVEDNPALQKSLVKSLGSFEGITVSGTASDGEEAVKAVLRDPPDLVLLDLELPSLHGIEVTRRIKERAAQIEILVLTSFDEEEKVYQAVKAGASGYLVKRVGPEKIHAAIIEVMQGGTVIEGVIARRFWNYFQSVRCPAGNRPLNPWGLDELERDVLQYLAKGLSNAEVGQVMSLERRTVRTHLSHIYKKMGVHSHVDAVVAALKSGLIEL